MLTTTITIFSSPYGDVNVTRLPPDLVERAAATERKLSRVRGGMGILGTSYLFVEIPTSDACLAMEQLDKLCEDMYARGEL